MTAASLAEIVVDLAAIRHNVAALAARVAPAGLMVVVKADAYGHGLIPVAGAAREAGADWLATATLSEALTLRAAGDRGPLLCWLWAEDDQVALIEGITRDIDISAPSAEAVRRVARAAVAADRVARLQLEFDTGMGRGGAPQAEWAELVEAARTAVDGGTAQLTGVWSHLALSDVPDHPANDAQQAAYLEALAVVESAGLTPGLRHLANSGAALLRPSAAFDLVRVGLAAYGLDPAPDLRAAEGLIPAMTLRSRLILVKRLAAGASVSYGYTWTADRDTTVGLVPLGYGDGILRHASSRAEVWVAGARRPVVGRICMDQFVVDLGGDLPLVGEPVVVFGPGLLGEPTAQDWAEAADTINYEVVVRLGGRIARTYVDSADDRGGLS